MAQANRGVIAIYSPKGGVGKTTLAVELAWRFAALGEARTLIWDMDPQGGSAYLLNVRGSGHGNAAGVFQKEGRPDHYITPTRYANLDILCADESLRALPWQLARLGRRHRLAEITGKLKQTYGRIVLDCPPMQNEVSDQILRAADVIVAPLPPSPLSARALDLLRRDMLRLDGYHPPILPVLSMYDGRRREHQLARASRMEGFPVIPLSADVERVAFNRAPLATFAAGRPANQAFDRLWRAIELRLATAKPLASAVALPVLADSRDQSAFGRLSNWLAGAAGREA